MMQNQCTVLYSFLFIGFLLINQSMIATCVEACNEDEVNAVDIKIVCSNNQTLTKTLQPYTKVWYKPNSQCLLCKFGYKFADQDNYTWFDPQCKDRCAIYHLEWPASKSKVTGSADSHGFKCEFESWKNALIVLGAIGGAVLFLCAMCCCVNRRC